MNRLLVTALLAWCFVPSWSYALEIKNIRPCYGPLGATRYDNKCLPGDVFWLTYDIEDLALDKSGKVNFNYKFEFIDPKKDVIFKKDSNTSTVPQLGGRRHTGDANVFLSPKQAPGKYTIRVTIHDKVADVAKAFSYPIEVLPPDFGFVGAISPALGVSGQPILHVTSFALVNLTLDKKNEPNATVTIRILGDTGKEVVPATQLVMPRDMPEDTDLQKGNFVPISFPINLNRPGRYTIDVQANDKNGNKSAKMSFPLTVLDVGAFTGK